MPKTPTRIYYITNNGSEEYLVEASTRSQAIRHVAEMHYTAVVATQRDIIDGLGAGMKIECVPINIRRPERDQNMRDAFEEESK